MKVKIIFVLLSISINILCFDKLEDLPDDKIFQAFQEYYYEKNLPKALQLSYEALKENPNEIGLYTLISDILLDLGKYEEGIVIVSKGLINPNIMDKFHLIRRRLILYKLANKNDLANIDWKTIKGLTLNSFGDKLIMLLLYIYNNEHDIATSMINDLLVGEKTESKYRDAMTFKIRLLYKEKKFTEAIVDIDNLLEIYMEIDKLPPEIIFFYKSLCFYKLEEIEKTKNNFEYALNVNILRKKIYYSMEKDIDVDDYLKPFEGTLSEFDFNDIKEFTDITEPNGKLSYENLRILKEVYNLF